MILKATISGFQSAQRELEKSTRRVTIAGSRAIRGTLSWVRTRIRREAAKSLNVPQRALQSRLVTSRVKNGDIEGKLWAGTWMLSPFSVGKPRQGKRGVVGVRGRSYLGAFIARVYPQELGRDNIWIRTNSKHFNPALFPGVAKKSRTTVPDHLRHRFPVAKAAIEIKPTMEQVFKRDESEILAELDKRLRREINFALNVEKR